MGAKEVLHKSSSGLAEEGQSEERGRWSGEASELLQAEDLLLAGELECYCSSKEVAFPQLSAHCLSERHCLQKA